MRLLTTCLFASLLSAQTSRELSSINWMEFRDLVPKKIETVLVPLGTLEAHGVTGNGTDITAPVAISKAMAERVNALVAPVVSYGITGRLDAFAGEFTISDEAYRAYVGDVLRGMARIGFKNIILINGHGGQSAVLADLAEKIGREKNVRILSIDWWSYCSDVTYRTFNEDGGHAGWNETAMIQAIDRAQVRQDLYDDSLALPRQTAGTWSAYPFPASIILYQPKQGYVKFDQGKADAYFKGVVDKLVDLTNSTVKLWDKAGIFR